MPKILKIRKVKGKNQQKCRLCLTCILFWKCRDVGFFLCFVFLYTRMSTKSDADKKFYNFAIKSRIRAKSSKARGKFRQQITQKIRQTCMLAIFKSIISILLATVHKIVNAYAILFFLFLFLWHITWNFYFVCVFVIMCHLCYHSLLNVYGVVFFIISSSQWKQTACGNKLITRKDPLSSVECYLRTFIAYCR